MRKKDDVLMWEAYTEKLTRKYVSINESSDETSDETSSPLTPEQITQADKLVFHATHNILRNKAPFLFHQLQELRVIKDAPGIDTMAVDGANNIYVSRKFVLEVLRTSDYVAGVLAHEVLHILNSTIPRQKDRTAMLGSYSLWNIATDFVMNKDLLQDGFKLPSMGCIPVHYGNGWSINLEMFNLPGHLDISNKRCEQVYDDLVNLIKNNNSVKAPPTPGGDIISDKKGKGGAGAPGGDGDEEGDGDAPCKQTGQVAGRGSSPGGWDQHIRGDVSKGLDEQTAITAQEREMLNNRIKQSIESAKRMGINVGSYLEPDPQPSHPWKKILRKYLENARTVKDMTKPRSFNASFGQVKASQKVIKGGRIKAVIAIDTSGSIGKKEIELVMNELREICRINRQLELRLLFWTERVYLDQVVEGDTGEVFKKILQLPIGTGGTVMSCVANTLGDESKDYNLVVYFTDGEVEYPPLLPANTDSIIILTHTAGDAIVLKLKDVVKGRGDVFKTDF